jgi:hypothetical protein
VQRYISEYKHLKEVAILMKKFLAIHNFNSPYYGKFINLANKLYRRSKFIQHSDIDSGIHELLRFEECNSAGVAHYEPLRHALLPPVDASEPVSDRRVEPLATADGFP